MLFSEPAFLFYFLPALLALHVLAPRALRNGLLLVASLLFYSWGQPLHVLLLIGSIGLNYAVGRGLGGTRGEGAARAWLAAGVAGNLLLLAHFKYSAFLAGVLGLSYTGPVLPIGISFFTFQALSYLIDVRRGRVAAQRNPLTLALYISMFPQLIAGPIVRYRDIEEQLAERRVELSGFAQGVRRFVIGLAKKLLIANSLALPADQVFAIPSEELTLSLAWLGIVAYTFQIYFDFSGYSDMAIGLGRMLGFRYRENFEHPYVSTSIREFWRRWHISLSTWFRDYLYLPLGGNRKSPARVALNLWLVFLLCGLWHGASWSFLVWGAFHGFFLVVERLCAWPGDARGPAPLARLYTLAVVLVGWVFFRADDLPAALAFLGALIGQGAGDGLVHDAALLVDARVWIAFAAALVGSTPWPRDWTRGIAARGRDGAPGLELGLRAAEILGLGALFLVCAAAMAAGSYDPFIYFRF